ncbi:hypothetical protein [Arthrobacter sp. TMS1-12-1]
MAAPCSPLYRRLSRPLLSRFGEAPAVVVAVVVVPLVVVRTR